MYRTKSFLAALLIVISVATTTASFAGEPETKGEKVKVFKFGKQVKLLYLSDDSLEVEINIQDEKGQVLYEGTTSSEKGFLLPFDMSFLPAGEYTFHIKEGDDEIISKVITQSTLTDKDMLTMVRRESEKSIVVRSTDKIPTDLDLVIYNEHGDIIYEALLGSKTRVNSNYNLEKVESDQIRIIIWEDNEILQEADFRF